jgi:hypothetical protein
VADLPSGVSLTPPKEIKKKYLPVTCILVDEPSKLTAKINLLFPFIYRFCMFISFPSLFLIFTPSLLFFRFIVIPLPLSPDIPQEAQEISRFPL